MWWTFFPIPFPYFDEYHTHKKPYITLILLWANFIVFILSLILVFALESFGLQDVFNNLGVVPADIMAGMNLHTLFTSLFVHTGILHFLGNMWFLYIFGDNVEHNMGKVNFFLFFLTAGIISALTYVYFLQELPNVPVVGASGAISGILGAYIMLFPENKIHVVLGPRTKFSISAFWYIWIWLILQGVYLFTLPEASTAFTSHMAGFAAGIFLAFVFGKRIKYKNYKYEIPDYLDRV